MVGAEQHRAEDAKRLAHRHLHAVSRPLPRTVEIPVPKRLAFTAPHKDNVYRTAVRAEPHKVALARRAKGFAPGKKVDCLKHIGLARRVVAVQQVDPVVKMQARRLRRAEILQRDRLYIHASFMRSGSTM